MATNRKSDKQPKKSKKEDKKTKALVKKSEVNSLLEIVMQDQDLGLTKAQEEAHRRLTRAHVTFQPARLRTCDKDCPMHDTCPYIVDIDPTHRPYGKRCPYEAELMQIAYEQNVNFAKSMDPTYDPEDPDYDIPNYEKGLCLEVAFYTVIEHRLSLCVAKDPSATVDAPVPGAAGGKKKEENPAYVSWTRAVDKKSKYQDKLQKAVEARLKRISQKIDNRETTLEAVRRIFNENREDLDKGGYNRLFREADKAVEKSVEDIGKRSKSQPKKDDDGETEESPGD